MNARTVVNHLDVVTRAGLTNPITARCPIGLGGGLLEDFLDGGPSLCVSTGHERRAVTGTLLTTRDTGADEEEALGLELLGAADRVGVVGVATVDDDVALVEVGDKLVDEGIDGRASLDEEDDLARRLELSDELLDRVGALDICA